MMINQTSSRAVINWNSFSISQAQSAQFILPSASGAKLNRVTGADLSSIYGMLQSNGRLYLINPNGILIGATGIIDTKGFSGSTRDISTDAFMRSGDLQFSGNSVGNIVNLGSIRALDGDVSLLANRVVNRGSISASGTVGLAGGNEILIKGADQAGGSVYVGSGSGSVRNSGSITASIAELKAAGGNQFAPATGAVRQDGRAFLTGRSSGPAIVNTGVITARNADGSGGCVRMAANNGTVALSGKIDASSATSAGGNVRVEAPEIKLTAANVDASGATGGGTINIGGGFGGRDSLITNAQNVTVDAASFLRAAATVIGDAGKITVWAKGLTTFDGKISA